MPRRFRRPFGPATFVWVVLLALIAYRCWTGFDSGSSSPQAPLAEGDHAVARVVDGDTLLLADETRIRLIGVDTPETVKPDYGVEPWGPEASDFTRDFVSAGQVRLQFDRERFDRHGRQLAFVWVGPRMLNEELLIAGLARFEPQYHYSETMKRRFRKAQQTAQAAKRGIWSTDSSPSAASAEP